MDVAIAGGHGQVARRLARLLAQRGDRVRGLIRNPEHAEDLSADGSEPVVIDLEAASTATLAEAIGGADAAVSAGVNRYVIVSSVGAESPPDDDDVFSVYLRAKAEADAAVMASDRDWTVLRPGPLTDDPGTGRVHLGTDPFRDAVTRDDVAAVLVSLLDEPRSAGLILYLANGDEPVDEALAGALA